MVIDSLNPTLRGWFESFKPSRHRTLGTLDGWIRRRLRSLLRKQQKLRGIAEVHGADHGLFSFQKAHATVRQSPCG